MDEVKQADESAPKSEWVLNCYRELVNSRDLVALHILAKLYKNPGTPYVLNALVKELRSITRCKTTIYGRCKKLGEMGLIDFIPGYPVLILPKKGIKEHMACQIIEAIDRRFAVCRE